MKKARVDKRKLHVPFLPTFNYFRSWPMSRSWGWLGQGRLMYSTCWPETMFWRQRKMNFENIFILPNVIGDRSRRLFGGIFIKFPKVTSTRSSLMIIHDYPSSIMIHHQSSIIHRPSCIIHHQSYAINSY